MQLYILHEQSWCLLSWNLCGISEDFSFRLTIFCCKKGHMRNQLSNWWIIIAISIQSPHNQRNILEQASNSTKSPKSHAIFIWDYWLAIPFIQEIYLSNIKDMTLMDTVTFFTTGVQYNLQTIFWIDCLRRFYCSNCRTSVMSWNPVIYERVLHFVIPSSFSGLHLVATISRNINFSSICIAWCW